MCDVRIVPCPYCEGVGGWEGSPYGYDPRDGSLLTHWHHCDHCNREGWVCEAVHPCTLEDLEEVDELEGSARWK